VFIIYHKFPYSSKRWFFIGMHVTSNQPSVTNLRMFLKTTKKVCFLLCLVVLLLVQCVGRTLRKDWLNTEPVTAFPENVCLGCALCCCTTMISCFFPVVSCYITVPPRSTDTVLTKVGAISISLFLNNFTSLDPDCKCQRNFWAKKRAFSLCKLCTGNRCEVRAHCSQSSFVSLNGLAMLSDA